MGKNRIVVIIIAVVVVASLTILIWKDLMQAVFPKQRIAVISMTGFIQEGSGGLFAPNVITPGTVRRLLKHAEKDDTIKAVVLRINSPGGSVAASQEISVMIKKFKKPVVVSMADMAVSGGYYISVHADMIIAQPGTMTGSIGVIWTHVDMSGLYEKLGIEVDTVVAGKHKDMFADPLTPERRDIMQRKLDKLHEQFIQAVVDGRELPVLEVRDLATGEIFIGQQALDLGLVDSLGGLQEAIDAAAEKAEVEVITVIDLAPPVPSLIDILFSGKSMIQELVVARLLGVGEAKAGASINFYNFNKL